MAIFRFEIDGKGERTKDASGSEVKVAVADFSYQNDALAQMIVDAWVNTSFKDKLLDKANAKSLLAERGIFLQKPVIIDEKTYWTNGYTKNSDEEVVFVLPDLKRVDIGKPQSLLETARLLMACVPNGI
jgi:hypothetical protein